MANSKAIPFLPEFRYIDGLHGGNYSRLSTDNKNPRPEAAIQIQRVSPNSKIVFVTQEDDPDVRRAATLAGVKEFALKANAASELLPTIAAVLRESRQPT